MTLRTYRKQYSSAVEEIDYVCRSATDEETILEVTGNILSLIEKYKKDASEKIKKLDDMILETNVDLKLRKAIMQARKGFVEALRGFDYALEEYASAKDISADL